MKYAIIVLTAAQAEIEEELERLNNLKGNPNEALRKISINSNKQRLEEIIKAKEIILKQ